MLGDRNRTDRRTGWIVALGVGALLSPLVLIALLRSAAAADIRWESHTAHFWLVLTAALITLGLGYALSVTARRRRDARLFLICARLHGQLRLSGASRVGDAGRPPG